MKRRKLTGDFKWVYSHISSEIYMQQYTEGYITFAVCGCSQQSGSLTVSEELGVHMAEMGRKTLLINADLYGEERRTFQNGKIRSQGFADFINGTASVKDILSGPYQDNFYYIGRGKIETDVKEQLLCSQRGETLFSSLRNDFDIIILHTPSLTSPASGRILCRFADAAIFIAAAGRTRKSQLEAAKHWMDELNVPVAGMIATRGKKTLWNQFSRRFDKNALIV